MMRYRGSGLIAVFLGTSNLLLLPVSTKGMDAKPVAETSTWLYGARARAARSLVREVQKLTGRMSVMLGIFARLNASLRKAYSTLVGV
jgi:hypothetical protein